MRLENWRLGLEKNKQYLHLHGNIYGWPTRFRNGTKITTSRIIERGVGWFKTEMGYTYLLGQPAKIKSKQIAIPQIEEKQ
jgi:hypothetical protein